MIAGEGDSLPVSAVPCRRHVSYGDGAVGEARHRAGDPRVGRGAVHPVREMRARLPARGDPREGLCAHAAGRRALHVQVGAGALARVRRRALHPSGRAGGLHGLRALRRGVPGQEQERGAPQGHQHDARAPAPRSGGGELEVLPGAPGSGPPRAQRGPDQGRPAPRAPVRVLRSLRGLRRDSVPQAPEPALRRSRRHRQCHRLLVDLRRQSADHTLDDQSRRTGTGLGQLALRGQCRVRSRHAAGPRQAGGVRERAGHPARAGAGRAGAGAARRRSIHRSRDRSPADAGGAAQGKLAWARRARGA